MVDTDILLKKLERKPLVPLQLHRANFALYFYSSQALKILALLSASSQ